LYQSFLVRQATPAFLPYAVFDDRASHVRPKVIGLYIVLIVANLLAWVWAFAAFHGYPLLLATALIAYGFGLRHAVDADHIAAIDNVTRKLMQEGKRPIAVGYFLPLGHSTVVIAAPLLLPLTAGNFIALGYLVVGIFAASWLTSLAIYRVMGYHEIGSA
jgi:high-affinity nickel-transport protein